MRSNFVIVEFATICSIARAFTSSTYGIPLAPLETVNIPEQGPVVFAPQFTRSLAFDIPNDVASSYGVPPISVAPLETIDLPEEGPQILLPPSTLLTRANEIPSSPAPAFIDRNSNLLYHFGYNNVQSAREERRNTNGVTQGFYSYVDPNGILQRVDYVVDPLHGYRILSNPVVEDTAEVSAAKAEFFKAYQAALEATSNAI